MPNKFLVQALRNPKGVYGDIGRDTDVKKAIYGYADQLANNIAEATGQADYARWYKTRNPEDLKAAKAKMTETAINFMPGAVGAIDVSHGSPHLFDKFDMSKIGTGEGAQAYGHGLYFAEGHNSPVAEAYRDALTKSEKQFYVNGNRVDPKMMDAFESNVLNAKGYGRKKQDYLDELEISRVSPSALQKISKIWDEIGDVSVKDVLPENASLYNVSLRWPDAAKEAATPLGPDDFLQYENAIPEELRKKLSSAMMDKFGSGMSMGSGEQAYRQLVDEFKFSGAAHPQDAARQWLSEQGIPGIRYLDAGSRGADQGTYNYVVFDDQIPKIIERNGQPVAQPKWYDSILHNQSMTDADYAKLTPAQRQELAQARAALPVEQGGLGLLGDNTAMQRADASGATDWYHGRYSDYDNINPNRTFYATQDPAYASIYAMEPTASSMGGKAMVDYDSLMPNVMPLKIRTGEVLDTRTKEGKKVFDKDFYMKYGNGTPLTDKKLPDWVDAEDFGEMFADTGSKYKGVFADEGKIPTWDGGLKDRGVSMAVFDPSIVRSRFAAFDPFRRNSSDILAGVGAGGIGIYGYDELNKNRGPYDY